MRSGKNSQEPVFTIGHSTHTLPDFLHLLQAYQVKVLVDVRTVPRSRHNPQFNKDALPPELRAVGIRYLHMPGLGGLRHARLDSPNKAWRNLSFRGYADYMQTPEFRKSLEVLMVLARKSRVAIMCAEALPWRCHRSMIADTLVMWGFAVHHIMNATHCQKHVLRPWAVVKRKRISYPAMAETEICAPAGNKAGKLPRHDKGGSSMTRVFKVGDHVAWNSEAGRVRGTIKKKVTSVIAFKGYKVHASPEEPQYLIKSDKTDHLAMHKGSALRKLTQRKPGKSAK